MPPDWLSPHTFAWNPTPRTWVDVVQGMAWLLLGLGLLPLLRRAARAMGERETRRRVLLIGGCALVARVLVPSGPLNWYAGIANVDLGAPIFTRPTTYMPLPQQWLTFVLGFRGILAVNILAGSAAAVLGWHVVRRIGHGDRVALLLGLGLALTPMYVRISASDSTHVSALPLWWLAALALQRLGTGQGGRADQVLLFAATLAACPIRLEAGLVMPSLLLLVARDREGLRRLWAARRRWLPVGATALALGMACNVAVHSASWQQRMGSFDPSLFLLQGLATTLFLVNPEAPGWIPLLLVALIWLYLHDTWRRGDGAELVATVLPFLAVSLPFLYTGKGIVFGLPATVYGVTAYTFLLLAAAKGGDLAWRRWQQGAASRTPLRRRLLLGLGAAVLAWSLLVPYRSTYAYMEEFGFLQKALPQRKARVLAIWDPTVPGGDYDCCLALPYPTFIGDFPGLSWQILRQSDVGTEALRHLDFDYYYPGSLVGVDVERLNTWWPGRLGPDPQMNARQQAALRRLQSMDAEIRQHYALLPERRATLPAHTFSWAPFRDDRLTLTWYRRVPGTEPTR